MRNRKAIEPAIRNEPCNKCHRPGQLTRRVVSVTWGIGTTVGWRSNRCIECEKALDGRRRKQRTRAQVMELAESLRALVAQGMTISAASKVIGIRHDYANHICRRNGIKQQPKEPVMNAAPGDYPWKVVEAAHMKAAAIAREWYGLPSEDDFRKRLAA